MASPFPPSGSIISIQNLLTKGYLTATSSSTQVTTAPTTVSPTALTELWQLTSTPITGGIQVSLLNLATKTYLSACELCYGAPGYTADTHLSSVTSDSTWSIIWIPIENFYMLKNATSVTFLTNSSGSSVDINSNTLLAGTQWTLQVVNVPPPGPSPGPSPSPSPGPGPGPSGGKPSSFISKYWWIFVVVGALVVGGFLLFFLLRK